MTASEFETIFYSILATEVGPIMTVERGGRLTRLFFTRSEEEGVATLSPESAVWAGKGSKHPVERKRTPILRETERQLRDYFARRQTVFDLPMRLDGTPFQKTVWKALLDIPFGQVVTYGEVARRIGRPTASRAVGGAVHCNPIAVIVPCHRVIGSNGKLTGYATGLDKKEFLLRVEGVMNDGEGVGLKTQGTDFPRGIRR